MNMCAVRLRVDNGAPAVSEFSSESWHSVGRSVKEKYTFSITIIHIDI